MATSSRLRKAFEESANVTAVRGLMIGLAALVVLVVSGFGTVVYIQLMSKVFPSGPLAIACYLGAAANFLLMIVLLVGKFTWFRPGGHEVTSWIVTGVELLVAILNLMLAFQLGNGGHLSSFLQAWENLAPISPVFSMVGATALIMTSTELRKRHRDLELQDKKDKAERDLELAFHEAEIDVKYKYLGIIQNKLEVELNRPERDLEIADHASMMVSQVLSNLSGMPSVPRLSSGTPPVMSHRPTAIPPVSGSLSSTDDLSSGVDDSWFQQVNERIEQERTRRLAADGASVVPVTAPAQDAGSGSPSPVDQVDQRVLREWMGLFRGRSADGSVALRRVEEQLGLFDAVAAGQGVSLPLLRRLEYVAATMLTMGYTVEDLIALGPELFSSEENGPSQARVAPKYS